MPISENWEQQTKYTNSGEVQDEYYWNSKLNIAVDTVEEVMNIENKTHPSCWNPVTHYGQCGQSCPCCRKRCGEIFGSCIICDSIIQKPIKQYNLRPRKY